MIVPNMVTFKTPEGAYVAQLLNSRNENADVNLEFKGKSLHLSLSERSITTANW